MRVRGFVFSIAVALGVLSAGASAQAPPPPPPPPPSGAMSTVRPSSRQVANELLDEFDVLLKMLNKAPLDQAEFGRKLGNMAQNGNACLEAGVFDRAFYARYERLLRALLVYSITDPGGLIREFTDRELGTFVKETTGQRLDREAPASEQIALFAEAVAGEMTGLRAAALRLP